tara:strand:- start:1773 stop:2096 length:324 start_codon:yes stop_codon:yes gene_type:complete
MIGAGIQKCIKRNILGIVNICNGTASLLYWIKPCNGCRRYIDVYTARISAIAYTVEAMRCNTIICVIKELAITGILYIASCVMYPRRIWEYVHVLFHIQSIRCMKLC